MRQSRMRPAVLLVLPEYENVRQEFAVGLERVRSVQEHQWRIPTTVRPDSKNAEHISYQLHNVQ